MRHFWKTFFSRNKQDETETAARPATVSSSNIDAPVSAATGPNPPGASANSTILGSGGPVSSTTAAPHIRITSVDDALVDTQRYIDELEQLIKRTTTPAASNQDSIIEYHRAEYITKELQNYNNRISMKYTDEEPEFSANRKVMKKWEMLEDTVDDVDAAFRELNEFLTPSNPSKAIPRDKALEFCYNARKVIQAERHAETLFCDFRDSVLNMERQSERKRAAKIQEHATRAQNRAQNAAAILGAIAISVNEMTTMAGNAMPGTT